MSVSASVAVAPADFLLARALTTDGSARIVAACVVPVADDPLPYLRVSSDDLALLVDLIAADPVVSHVEVIHRGKSEWELAIDWTGAFDGLLAVLRDTDGACTEAVATGKMWYLQLRFRSRERLSTWYRRCSERGIRVDVERIVESDAGERLPDGSQAAMTEAQREALTTALAAGYFSVPRGATLEEVAVELGISDTATSQRIRRGIRNLLDESLGPEGRPFDVTNS
ncbi:helix-turn-helix domain-containing protein [Halobaculum limi]|uniref:helix-turn-helix domain-containing protein n=1 Tax=Halobaculum limi TaxID=3031916 RepID=UPI0024074FCB|nr:helix-turn-helix domain-containing protein [Halobaculum sp. YSMS11]